MAEWLYEAGIGEARAALVDDDRIVDAAIEPEDGGLRVGTVGRAKLVELRPGRAARLLIDGHEAHLAVVPAGMTQGATLGVEVIREAIPTVLSVEQPVRVVDGDRVIGVVTRDDILKLVNSARDSIAVPSGAGEAA